MKKNIRIIFALLVFIIVVGGAVFARDARVISITPREQATLLEIEFLDTNVRTTVHVMSKTLKVTPGEKIEVVQQPNDQYSLIIRTFFYQKADFQAMIPRPAEVK